MATTLREQILSLVPKIDAGNDVRLWPPDEQDLHRNGDWRSFTERNEGVNDYRRGKVADALLALIEQELEHARLEGAAHVSDWLASRGWMGLAAELREDMTTPGPCQDVYRQRWGIFIAHPEPGTARRPAPAVPHREHHQRETP